MSRADYIPPASAGAIAPRREVERAEQEPPDLGDIRIAAVELVLTNGRRIRLKDLRGTTWTVSHGRDWSTVSELTLQVGYWEYE